MKSRRTASGPMAVIASMMDMMPQISYLLNSGYKTPVNPGGKQRRIAMKRYCQNKRDNPPGSKMIHCSKSISKRACDGTLR